MNLKRVTNPELTW